MASHPSSHVLTFCVRRSVVIVTVFLEGKTIDETQATLSSLELFPLTERDVAGALSNPFSDGVADKIIQLAADHGEDIDLNELVFDSVVRAIDNPCTHTRPAPGSGPHPMLTRLCVDTFSSQGALPAACTD